MQLSSPAPVMVQRSADDPSLVQVLLDQQSLMLEHGERTRQEAKAEKAEMNAKIDQLREELKSSPPTPALSNEQLSGLQLRLQALHAPKLLTDEQFIRLEDLCADYIELATLKSPAVVTQEMAKMVASGSGLLRLAGLSENMDADVSFARRQAIRKFCAQ